MDEFNAVVFVNQGGFKIFPMNEATVNLHNNSWIVFHGYIQKALHRQNVEIIIFDKTIKLNFQIATPAHKRNRSERSNVCSPLPKFTFRRLAGQLGRQSPAFLYKSR